MTQRLFLGGETKKQVVKLQSGDTFTIHYRIRNVDLFGRESREGVFSNELVSIYSSALKTCYGRLINDDSGLWQNQLGITHNTNIFIRDLGTNVSGVANPNWCRARKRCLDPNISLTNRPNTCDTGSFRRHCFATVAHELAHLLQFETGTWQYWPKNDRIGSSFWRDKKHDDPNWWLHEATAYAIEGLLCGVDQLAWYHLLWGWATQPERSMDSQPCGLLAAPFVYYLTSLYGSGLISRVYALSETQVPSMLGIDLLAESIRKCSNAPSASHIFNDLFRRYCVEAFIANSLGFFRELIRVVGPRAISNIIEDQNKDGRDSYRIDSFGCRYFKIPSRPPGSSADIVISLSKGDMASILPELVIYSKSGAILKHDDVSMMSGKNEIRLKTPHLSSDSCEQAILMIANGLHKDGASSSEVSDVCISLESV